MYNPLGYKLLHSYDHLRALTKLYEFCWGPFHEGPDMFSHPESRWTISNLTNMELFYLRILNMDRGSLHTRGFRRRYTSLRARKKGLSRNGPLGLTSGILRYRVVFN